MTTVTAIPAAAHIVSSRPHLHTTKIAIEKRERQQNPGDQAVLTQRHYAPQKPVLQQCLETIQKNATSIGTGILTTCGLVYLGKQLQRDTNQLTQLRQTLQALNEKGESLKSLGNWSFWGVSAMSVFHVAERFMAAAQRNEQIKALTDRE